MEATGVTSWQTSATTQNPVGAMALLAEALLASADDSDTVRRFAEKVLIEANRLGDMVAELIELSRLQGAERLPTSPTLTSIPCVRGDIAPQSGR